MQTVYAYTGRDLVESRRTLQEILRREFTEGELEIEQPAGDLRFSIQKGVTQPILVMRATHGARIWFRRSWHHIRAHRAAAYMMYFVHQGGLQVVSSTGSYMVRQGQFGIVNADQPYYARTVLSDRGIFDCTTVVVPEHAVLSHMPWARECDRPLDIGNRHSELIAGLLDFLCLDSTLLRDKTAELMAIALLELLSDVTCHQVGGNSRYGSAVDRRFAEIQACIRKHLTAADLTCDRVAAYCGVSPRYVCHVLKAKGTSFSELLWSQRLAMSREWLVSEAYRGYPIHKIAFMAGFKSAAHFSRIFKSAYGVSPKHYRVMYADAGTNALFRDHQQQSDFHLPHKRAVVEGEYIARSSASRRESSAAAV